MNGRDEKSDYKRNKGAYCKPMLILTGLFVIMIACQLPRGCVYGSTVDWLSQHVALAETIRNACIDQKTLLPSFLWLGGGSNGFNFSYYGYLRPDILIGCLFPAVPMVWILITYMLCGYLVSVLLCFVWLRMETKSERLAFFGSVLFLCAGCFFHTHRQVMFINYMPFLLAAFISIRKKWYCRTILFLVLVYCNSFYYGSACCDRLVLVPHRGEKIFKALYFLRRSISRNDGSTVFADVSCDSIKPESNDCRRHGSPVFAQNDVLFVQPLWNGTYCTVPVSVAFGHCKERTAGRQPFLSGIVVLRNVRVALKRNIIYARQDPDSVRAAHSAAMHPCIICAVPQGDEMETVSACIAFGMSVR